MHTNLLSTHSQHLFIPRGNHGPTPRSDGPGRRGSGRHAPNTHRRGGGEVVPEGPQGRALGIQGTASAIPSKKMAHKTCSFFCFVGFSAGNFSRNRYFLYRHDQRISGLKIVQVWRAKGRTIGKGTRLVGIYLFRPPVKSAKGLWKQVIADKHMLRFGFGHRGERIPKRYE